MDIGDAGMEAAMEQCLSLIVATRDRPDDMRRLIAGIEMNDCRLIKEVIIVDDGSHGMALPRSLVTQLPVTVLREEKSVGPALCRNRAAQIATGKYLVFLTTTEYRCLTG